MTLDIEHLRSWIGHKDSAQEVLTKATVDRFNATFDRDFPARDGETAPLLIHFCLCQPTIPTAQLASDGHAKKGGFLPPVPLPRRMWAGGQFDFHGDIRVGDEVSRVSEIENVELKHGRTGPLCFVTVRHHISSAGNLVVSERQDIVYRAADTEKNSEKLSPKAADTGTDQKSVDASAALLFRYSALTFNAHRIHYDMPYAQEQERYPGLVIHGPIQATLLCQYAADLKSRKPQSFSFRSIAPLFGPSKFGLNAADSGDSLKLWTAAQGGPIAMTATAQW